MIKTALTRTRHIPPGVRNFVIFAALVAAAGIAVSVIEPPEQLYIGTLKDTLTVNRILTALLAGFALWSLFSGIRAFFSWRVALVWRLNLRNLPLPLLITALVLWVALSTANDATGAGTVIRNEMPWQNAHRVIETIIPLAMGIQAALLFSPPDEPAIESQLACPRPIVYVLIERLALVVITQTALALVGILLYSLMFDQADVGLALVRWIPPALLFTGVGVFATIRSRQVVFGVAVAGVVAFVSLFFATALLPGMPYGFPINYIQPYTWVISPYLQPEYLPMDAYWLNRLCLAALGITLLALAVRDLGDEERVLLGIPAQKTNHN